MSDKSINLDCMAFKKTVSVRAKAALTHCVIVGAILAILPARSTAGDATLIESFTENAPKEWEAYAGFSISLIGKGKILQLRDEKLIKEQQFEIKGNDQTHVCETTIIDHESKKDKGLVLGYNPKYTFNLNRGDRGWALTQLSREPDNKIKDDLSDMLNNVLQVGICANEKRLLFLMRQPHFRVLDVRLQKADSGELVVVDFENPHALNDMPFCGIQSGSMVLDKNNRWVMVSGKFDCLFSNVKATVEEDNTFREGSGGLIPVRHVMTSKQSSSERSFTYKAIIEYQLEEAPKEASNSPTFGLASYGLPEIPEQKGSMLYYYSAGGAIVLVVLSIVLRFLARRYSTT